MFWIFILGFSDAQAKVPHAVPHLLEHIEVDGKIDEPIWQKALKVELNYEVEPGENIQPPVKTEVYIFTTETHLYTAFRCSDPNPDQIRARFTDRDDVFNDDFAGIVLDTFNDERRAYEFMCNPFGIQADAINDDVGGNYDLSWNALWKSKGIITENGWQFEMAIPFHQLRFPASSTDIVWGFDAFRSYPRNDRHHIGFFARERGAQSYLAQESKLSGFSDLYQGRGIEVVPTFTSINAEKRPQGPGSSFQTSNSQTEGGLSVKWGVTPNVTLDATANPDFSQVEADTVQLDVNETFSLFYEETRPFFLEGADYFNTPMNLLHTRVIGNPDGAVKVTGKSSKHTYGGMVAQDEDTTILMPGVQGSDTRPFRDKSQAYIGRYRYDWGNNSTVGVMATSRNSDGYHNNVLSIDAKYFVTDADRITLNFAHAATGYSEEMQEAFELSDEQTDISDQAFLFDYRRSKRNYSIRLNYSDYGHEYRADLGFQPQVGTKRALIGAERVWYFDGQSFFNKIRLGADWDQTEDFEGNLIEREYEFWFPINMRGQTFFNFWSGVRDRVFRGEAYDQSYAGAYFEKSSSSGFGYEVEYSVSDWIDFRQNREADRKWHFAGINWKAGNHFNVRLQAPYEILDIAEGNLYKAFFPQARIVYYHNERMFVRAILQYQKLDFNTELYASEQPPEQEELFTQVLFSYKLNPQTLAFIGYSDFRQTFDELSLRQSDRNFFLKFSYAWLP